MREFMTIVESAFYDDQGEDETNLDALPASAGLNELRPQFIAVAQRIYDEWSQDEDGNDIEHGSGGICHVIAEEMAGIMSHAGYPCTTQTATHEQHVYCVVQASDGVFEVDIPWRVYEVGSMFTWTKLPDITFKPTDVTIYQLDRDPANIGTYVEEW